MRLAVSFCLSLALLGVVHPAAAQKSSHMPYVPPGYPDVEATKKYVEPNAQTALGWWIPQRGVWTPIGWKDHLLRFTMPYNGALMCTPAGILQKPHTKKYVGQDFQLTFHPSVDGKIPPLPKEWTRIYKLDNGLGWQGWDDKHETPVMWNKWPLEEGLVLRTDTFAHMAGGGEVTTATEPLYAWVRMSVDHVDPNEHPEKYKFAVHLSKVWFIQGGAATPDEIAYLEARPELAVLDKATYTSASLAGAAGEAAGLELRENGKVRLRVLPGGDGKISLTDAPDNKGYILQVELPAREGAKVDMAVGMLTEDPNEFAREAALGYDGALAEAEAYWSRKPETAATIHTPEKYINEALRRNIQFAQIVAELNPENGEYSFLSGSYGYDTLWSTPTSMISHMFLDLLGYHDVVAKHLHLYKKNQGSVKPPGKSFELDPGYFSTPKTLTALDWLGDHGAIMEAISRHALLTGDKEFVDFWIEPLVKACAFLEKATGSTDHKGAPGVIPPAIASDTLVEVQSVWTQAWCYKGLDTTVQVLQALGHPRAAEFAKVRSQFKEAFQTAFQSATAKQPTWRDPDGGTRPVLPAFLIAPPENHMYDDAFLLDTGALCLPWAGLLDANQPEMKSFADYFRVGPPTKLWGPRSNSISRAILMHEISSCEPCYSWNIVNSWQTGDRAHFLEGMYALFTGAISPQTYINCEHRNNMYGTVFVAPLMTWCMRQAVIDDQLEADAVHLLRLCPTAWVTSAEETVFDNMPTNYGPVSLRWRLSEDGKQLIVNFAPQWRSKPGRVVFHVPPVAGLQQVTVNGQVLPYEAGAAGDQAVFEL
jgi:hypothetical protein